MARNEVARDESRGSEALAAGADPRFRTPKAWGTRQKEGFLDFVPTNTVRSSSERQWLDLGEGKGWMER